jgi:membrane-bound ClpP family serine protease
VLSGGLNPGGVVRVAAEEWMARSENSYIPEASKIRVTRLDGLVLTVEPLEPEHAPTGGAVPARGGNT